MSCVGLKDLHGNSIRWDAIKRGEGCFADPLPVMLALYYPRRRYADVTVTQLAGDLRQAILRDRTDYYENPDDMQSALFGTAMHAMFSAKGTENMLSEERLTAEIEGVKLGGIPDLYVSADGGTVIDYKTCSAWQAKAIMGGMEKPEWQYQVNAYAWLLRRHGFSVECALIRGFVRDYRASEKRQNEELRQRHIAGDVYKSGPRKGTVIEHPGWYDRGFRIPIPLMPHAVIEQWLKDRVQEWKRMQDQPEPEWPICDTWERDGRRTRCLDYCAVSFACSTHKEYLLTMNPKGDRP